MTYDGVLEPPPPELPGLTPAPAELAKSREALHRLAEDVLSPIQAAVNGDIHFRWTPGGFGTPRFGSGRQLRVEGATLVTVEAGAVGTEPIAGVDDAAARWLGDFYGFAFAVLDEIARHGTHPAPIRLWPEHFDIATELGDESAGTRATYGASPGDENHDEPYLYVGPWAEPPGPPELWNARGFTGAELTLSDLLAADDQRAAALEFFRRRIEALG
jgi:hypothetical protein